MGDLFGGPFFAPSSPDCGGTMGERHDGACHFGGSSLAAGATTLPPQFGGAAKGKRL